MFFKVAMSFFYKIYSFSKKSETSVTKMAKKTSNFSSFMTMINMESPCLKCLFFFRFFIANQTSIILFLYQEFILFIRNTVSILKKRSPTISRNFLSIICSPFHSPFIMAWFTNWESSKTFSGLVKFKYRFADAAIFTSLKFTIHTQEFTT